MSTNTGATATESTSDAVVSPLPRRDSDVDVGNGVMAVVRADSLDLKTETLGTEVYGSDGGDARVLDAVDSDIAVGDEVMAVAGADLLDLKAETLGMEGSGGGVEGLGGDVRVSDVVVSSELCSNSDNGRMAVVGADSLYLKTETLGMELSGSGGVVEGLVGDARVSDAVVSSEPRSNSESDVVNEVMDVVGADSLDLKAERLTMELSGSGGVVEGLGGDARVSDAVVSSEPRSNSDSDVVNEVMDVVGADSLDLKAETLAMEPSGSGGGVEGLGGDARVSDDKVMDGLGSDAVVSVEPLSNGDIAVGEGVRVVVETEALDLKTETLSAHPSSDVQDLVDNARDSGGETGVEMDEDGKRLDESSSDVVAPSVPPAASGGDSIAVQDLGDDARVSGDEIGVVMDEKLLDEPSSDAVVSSVPPDASDGVKIGADLLESKSETLTSDHDVGGDVAVQDLTDDGKVSRDERAIVNENSELVMDKPISDAVVSSVPLNNRGTDAVNGVKIGTDSVGSEPETLTMNPSADQNGDEKGIVKEDIEVINEEKEGEYKATDIVWAKVKDYPWWPGQIFDPSSSTDKAKKYSNKKGFLVGYFGDQTFAWNKASNIKPFRKNFSKLVKQSNSKAFFHAVDCALDEVSRRVDFGLACSCLSKEVYDKIKTQVFVNSGVREEDSKIDGGDRFSTVSTFKPENVVQSVQDLAREQFDGFSRLEVMSVRTQLLAFFRWKGWKGYYQFQAQDIFNGPDDKLEDESGLPLTEENKVVKDEKQASVGKKVSSETRKPDACDSDDSVPRKKERSLTKVTPKGDSGVGKSKKNISKKGGIEDDIFKEEKRNVKADSVGKKVSSKKRKADGSDSDDSVPHKKERSLTNVTSKGNSSVKRSKKGISKKATDDDDVDVVDEENGNEKPDSVGKKVTSKKRKPDDSDSDSVSDDSVPRKKERSLTKVTSKGVKRSKETISKKTTVEDNEENENEKTDSVGEKVSSKKRKPDDSDGDSDDSVPRKKERSLTKMTSKGVKRVKETISKKAVDEGNGNEKSDSVGKKVSSKKRKADVSDSDDSVPRKKERSPTNVTPKGKSSVKRSKQGISKKATVEDAVENGNGTDSKKSSSSTPRNLFRIGNNICKIAKQISESPSVVKKESQKSKDEQPA